jgi:thymidylate synthase (FAD)
MELYSKVPTSRRVVPEIETLLHNQINIPDMGYITVRNYMGTDQDIVDAARISYGEGTKHVSNNKSLIRYLMRNDHTSPFEMCELVLEIFCPMDLWRQQVRHRTASINEYSTRYSEAIDKKQTTDSRKWRKQSTNNKQGSGEYLEENVGKILTLNEKCLHQTIDKVYKKRLELGVAREQARKDLPLSNYTKAIWKIDLHNLLHFLSLRMDSHAQLEIREYANIIGNIVSKWVPYSWDAFNKYNIRRNAIKLTEFEVNILKYITKDINLDNIDINEVVNKIGINGDMSKREVEEFKNKLEKIRK